MLRESERVSWLCSLLCAAAKAVFVVGTAAVPSAGKQSKTGLQPEKSLGNLDVTSAYVKAVYNPLRDGTLESRKGPADGAFRGFGWHFLVLNGP